jgi:hypothetical protein
MKSRQLVLVAGLCLTVAPLGACSAAVWNGVAAGLASANGTATQAGPGRLMLFGGAGHKTFLGCVNCNEYHAQSVFNQYGSFGSSYSSTSVLNKYAEFGSKYSSYGACNPHASDPPVVVDGAGRFYGRLTMNQYHAQRTNDTRLLAWLSEMCE